MGPCIAIASHFVMRLGLCQFNLESDLSHDGLGDNECKIVGNVSNSSLLVYTVRMLRGANFAPMTKRQDLFNFSNPQEDRNITLNFNRLPTILRHSLTMDEAVLKKVYALAVLSTLANVLDLHYDLW